MLAVYFLPSIDGLDASPTTHDDSKCKAIYEIKMFCSEFCRMSVLQYVCRRLMAFSMAAHVDLALRAIWELIFELHEKHEKTFNML